MANNAIDYDSSINEIAEICHTSRTSALRLAKKLGFKGYSELKYFLTSEKLKKEDLIIKEDPATSTEKEREVFERLKNSQKIYIYGNGAYEEIICLEIKRLLLNLKILSETYRGGDEIANFNEKTLDEAAIFIVDFSNNDLSQNILVNIANISCLKIFVGIENSRLSMSDYNIVSTIEKENDIQLISPAISDLEEFFLKFASYRRKDENL